MIPDVDMKGLGLVLLAVALFAAAAWFVPDAVSAVVAAQVFGV